MTAWRTRVTGRTDDRLKLGKYMANGSERLDRIERILEQVVSTQQEMVNAQQQLVTAHQQLVTVQQQMVNAQQQLVTAHQEMAARQQQVVKTQQEMAARQQYHDEAFERHDGELKLILEAIAADAENIRALARIAELHHQRLDHLEGGASPDSPA